MTKEEAKRTLEDLREYKIVLSDIPFNDQEKICDLAISALSADGEYIKKEDAISKILIEFTERESNGKVMCACADVKQTCADILDGLPTYSFPDSADTETWNGYHGTIPAPKGTFDRIYEECEDSEDDI